jgi:hypothetical protein
MQQQNGANQTLALLLLDFDAHVRPCTLRSKSPGRLASARFACFAAALRLRTLLLERMIVLPSDSAAVLPLRPGSSGE